MADDVAHLSPSKRKLYERWRSGTWRPPASPVVDPIPVRHDRSPVSRASFFQESLWRLMRACPPTSALNLTFAAVVRGHIDEVALRQAFDELTRRHETLRSTFEPDGDRLLSRVHDEPTVELEVVNVSQAAEAERLPLAIEMARDIRVRPLSVSDTQLARAVLFRLDDDRSLVFLLAHHLVCDGLSLAVAMRELDILYHAHATGYRPSGLDPLRVQYRDFAAWHWDLLDGGTWEAERRYWDGQFAGLPTRFRAQRPGDVALDSGRRRFDISTSLADSIGALAKEANATTFAVYMAAVGIVVARELDVRDVAVGFPFANRWHADTDPLIGLFADWLAVRLRIGDLSFAALVREVQSLVAAAYANQHVTLPIYLEGRDPRRDPFLDPVYPVLLSIAPPSPQLELGGAVLEPVSIPRRDETMVELAFNILHNGGALSGKVDYRTAIWDHSSVEQMAEAFTATLHRVAADPSARVPKLLRLIGS